MVNYTVAFRERQHNDIYVFDALAITHDYEGRVFSSKVGAVVVNVETGTACAHGAIGEGGEEVTKKCINITKDLKSVFEAVAR